MPNPTRETLKQYALRNIDDLALKSMLMMVLEDSLFKYINIHIRRIY